MLNTEKEAIKLQNWYKNTINNKLKEKALGQKEYYYCNPIMPTKVLGKELGSLFTEKED